MKECKTDRERKSFHRNWAPSQLLEAQNPIELRVRHFVG